MSVETSSIPFSFFCSLVREISKLPAPQTRVRQVKHDDYPALQVFRKWVEELRKRFSPLPSNTTAICFRMLFPEEDIRRRFDIQETKMTQLLADCFGVEAKVFQKWSLEESSGCLGQELKVVLERSCSDTNDSIGPRTIEEIDELLDKLASSSTYSHKSIRLQHSKNRTETRTTILRTLFRPLCPHDASVLTQIILKDLRPLLYPLTEFHYTAALTHFNSASVRMLTLQHAMSAWDPSGSLLRFYRVQPCVDEAAAFSDQPSPIKSEILPKVASPIAIPRSEKGLGCPEALELLRGSERVWAETKYDGERAQIHVEVRSDNSSHITIYSKSKRDSTQDRRAVHDIVRRALGLLSTNSQQRKAIKMIQVKHNVVLDAEMVAFRGVQVEGNTPACKPSESESHLASRIRILADESMRSDLNDFNLGLIFFDVLILDSQNLMFEPYLYRREILEGLILTEPGQAILADRFCIDMSTRPQETLAKIFDQHKAAHLEGLVLKAEESWYNDYRKPWVKLKKDYIPGHGDTLDLVIIGAGWEKVRGRKLRVPPTTLTTFYIGGLANRFREAGARPHFHVYFTVSYGLSRDQLEEVNFLIKSSNLVDFSLWDNKQSSLPFTFTMYKGLRPPPSYVLRTPLLAELFGAGFTKARASKHYELRFPRVSKVYRPSERSWTDGADLQAINAAACNSVGRDRTNEYIEDWARNLFQSNGSSHRPEKRNAPNNIWNENEPKPYKKICYDSSSSPIHQNRTGATQSSLSTGLPLGPSPNKTSIAHNITSTTKTLTCPLNTQITLLSQTTPIVPATLFRNDMLETAIQTQDTKFPFSLQEHDLCWFAPPVSQSRQPCLFWTSWKRQIARERRLHSLASFLVGCGWTTNSSSGHTVRVKRGVIVVDDCDETCKTSILDTLNDLQRSNVFSDERAAIWVFGCRPSRIPLRLYK
ncbi:hypothetical protein BYT27DRAFT_7227272 [Phlegmacium glaucopus]|nr:hypothetical protein BYT27DRAFT_7227272 [Phlegmacium glaucopus]